MKKSLLIRLHIYCGLFTSFYLISLGLSSLVLNHKLEIDHKSITKTWTTTTQIDTTLDDQELATYLRDQLGFMGWVPPWRFQRNATSFGFEITHLGKTTDVKVDLTAGKTEVNERRKGFLAVFHGMHFFNGKIPNSPVILQTFAVYQYLALATLLVSLILGLWLWLKFSYRRWEFILFGSIFLSSVIIMWVI
jgi:hypothetical protein